jgi:hypothetical protein
VTREPFLPSMRTSTVPPPGMPRQVPEAIDVNAPLKLTLPLGHLGNEKRDKSIYDDKLMTQAEYRFDGLKDGAKWKSKVERYSITKVPVALEVLKWAEAHNLEKITESKFVMSAHPYFSEEQCQAFNREIWGFLSGCLTGQAETHFKRADMLNGLDAWRRVVRIIEDTLPMRFEQLRRAAQTIHMKVIKDLEGIPNGIAEFETTLEEYEAVGGARSDDQVMKADLLAILPGKCSQTSSGSLRCRPRPMSSSAMKFFQSQRIFWIWKSGTVTAEAEYTRSTRTTRQDLHLSGRPSEKIWKKTA